MRATASSVDQTPKEAQLDRARNREREGDRERERERGRRQDDFNRGIEDRTLSEHRPRRQDHYDASRIQTATTIVAIIQMTVSIRLIEHGVQIAPNRLIVSSSSTSPAMSLSTRSTFLRITKCVRTCNPSSLARPASTPISAILLIAEIVGAL